MSFPADREAAEDVFNQIQLVELALHRAGQPCDILRPDLVGRCGRMTGRLAHRAGGWRHDHGDMLVLLLAVHGTSARSWEFVTAF